MGKIILRIKLLVAKYQFLVFQVIENGDELCGLLPSLDSIINWIGDIIII